METSRRTWQNLEAGEYTVLVKDLNGVGVTASITLTQPGSIEVDLTAPTYPNGHHTTCYNCSNGSVTTTVTGGVMPYTYSWNTGQNTQNLSNLMAGTYSVLVTDANGCTKPDVKIDLTEPDRDDWTMTGNTTITSGVGILGTLDTSSISIQTNNTERVLIDKDGVVSLRGRLQLFESSTDSTRDVLLIRMENWLFIILPTMGFHALDLRIIGFRMDVIPVVLCF